MAHRPFILSMSMKRYFFLSVAAVICSCGPNAYVDPDLDPEISVSGTFTSWPKYTDVINYDFSENKEEYTPPTENLPYAKYFKETKKKDLSMEYTYGGWSYFAGPNANSKVSTDTLAVQLMLEQLETDAKYLREVMGWPPTELERRGYRNAVFLYGSGLTTDNAKNTETGGWQSWVNVYGTEYPVLLLSYYPVDCFSPDGNYNDRYYHTHAVTHEYIHVIFNSMPGCRNASWFHEGANCWLQAYMDAQRAGDAEIKEFGWLCAGTIIAPFIPIECYGGWLHDDSFGGPNWMNQGLNNNTRRILGGVQYSEVFPSFMGEFLGKGSVPWVWQNCKGYVLDGISKQMGDEQVKRMIKEFRARIALCDMGRYSNATLKIYKANMGENIASDIQGKTVEPWKATPYVSVSEDETGWLVPERRTLPGWTGANIIPVDVTGLDELITAFKPEGPDSSPQNMSCQLCYRTKEGKTVYGEPFSEGSFRLDLSGERPANDVVFAIVCNTSYKYTNTIRKTRYDYRLKFSEGAVLADIHKKWFDWKSEIE